MRCAWNAFVAKLSNTDDTGAGAEEEQEIKALTERRWSGGAMVLCKLQVPGRPTISMIEWQGYLQVPWCSCFR